MTQQIMRGTENQCMTKTTQANVSSKARHSKVTHSSKIDSLYERVGRIIYARCRMLLRDPTAAQDATQEIFLKLLRMPERLPDDDGLLPFVARMTKNHCLNILRSHRLHAEPMAPDEMPEITVSNFENSVVSKNFTERLFADQPEHLKGPAMLYHCNEMEQSTIADTLDISRRTVLYRLAEFNERAQRFLAVAEEGLG